jgi:hypothetical protein
LSDATAAPWRVAIITVPPVVAQGYAETRKRAATIRVCSRTTTSEVDRAAVLDCADGPLWIVESEPV